MVVPVGYYVILFDGNSQDCLYIPENQAFFTFRWIVPDCDLQFKFFPNWKDEVVLRVNILALVALLLLFLFPQSDRVERICKKFPNLSLYFLYSGWVPYMFLPLYLFPWIQEMFVSEIMVSMLMTYVIIYGAGMIVSYIAATIVIIVRFLRKRYAPVVAKA